MQQVLDRLPAGSTVVDLGCGPGDPATRLLSEQHDVVGVDLSAGQLRIARRLAPRASLVQADLVELALQPSSVDAVVSFYALGHLPSEAHVPLIERIGSWLRPGGLFLTSAPLTPGDDVDADWLGVPMSFGGIGRRGDAGRGRGGRDDRRGRPGGRRGRRRRPHRGVPLGHRHEAKLTAWPKTPLDRVRAACLALPEVTERLSHGAPSFFVREKKTFVMFMDDHHGDGRLALWCAAPPGAQEEMIGQDPDRFFRPPYVGHRGWLGVRVDGRPDWAEVVAVINEAYRTVAPKALVAQLDAR